jgi:hypothetical protein
MDFKTVDIDVCITDTEKAGLARALTGLTFKATNDAGDAYGVNLPGGAFAWIPKTCVTVRR